MIIDKKYNQSSVIQLLAEDNEYAFQIVFDAHKNEIYKVALLYLKSPILAEEVVQDTFLKLWFHRKNLQDINSLEAWLHTVCKNLVLNCLKKLSRDWTAKKDWGLHLQQVEETADLKVRNDEFNRVFLNAIAQLPEQQRLVYTLAKEEGLSYDAIGKKLAISPLTVKTHMARALSAIRSHLKKYGHLLSLLSSFL